MSRIRKYHNHTPQTNPRKRQEEPQNRNSHKTSGRQFKKKRISITLMSDHGLDILLIRRRIKLNVTVLFYDLVSELISFRCKIGNGHNFYV